MTVTSGIGVADDLAGVNLADPATFAGPGLDEVWRRLRATRPVWRHPRTVHGPHFWVVTRYADALAVYKDPATFVSGHGNMLTSLLTGGDTAGGKLLAVSDVPRHTAVRATLLRSFSPRMLKPVLDAVRSRADRLVAAMVTAGGGDFARDVADELPIGTICDLLGVPPADRAALLRLSKQALSSDVPDQPDHETWLARNEILLYFHGLAADRRRNPRDDVISTLATCDVQGAPLTDEEVVLNCYGLILAGDETSRLAMISAVLNFVEFPAQWRALRRGEVSPDDAVEEILRWNTPAMHVGRVARRDAVLGGQSIPAGDVVTVWNASANRDEEVFDRPDVFDLGRSPNKHLTFGHGPHFCLGAFLGRAEVRAVVDALRRRVRTIELRGRPTPLYSTFLRGYSSLPVAFGPAG
ncbi:cytochrome P450 [Micromonospora sp. KC213]|nr:cytochrome P450 [Micromonospora sp. KC213]